MKKKIFFILILLLCLLLSSCGKIAATETSTDGETQSTAEISSTAAQAQTSQAQTSESESVQTQADSTDYFSERDLSGEYSGGTQVLLKGNTAECSSNAVEISGSRITLKDEGVYILSGTLDDGMIIVNADKSDKLQLVLSGVDINSESSAAIYVLQADKVFISLADSSVNTLSNGGSFTAIDDSNIDAVIFSKEDLSFNGTGTLNISSPAGHGVVSKDDLIITEGIYNISSASHGLSGKDCVNIAGGSFTIASGKDCIHAENADDATLGYMYISSGSFKLTADGDGLSAENYLQLDGGDFNILTGGGSANVSAANQSGGWASLFGGQNSSSEDSVSAKGIKAAGALSINAGSFVIDSADDALHSNSTLDINGGSFTIASGDDGAHADAALTITSGSINITKSYEGLEGLSIDISGGEISLKASDDGLNAAGGNDGSGFNGFGFGDSFASSSDCFINISGGTLYINADGDGIDSNGRLNVSGGASYISGPVNGANGALDYDGSAVISGGVFVATGSSQMAMNFSSAQNQGAALVSTGSQQSGSTISLSDSSGNVLLSWQSEKSFDCVLISCPGLSQGESYTLSAGGYSSKLTLTSLIYGATAGMGGIGGMGGMGGMGGNRP